MPQSYINMTGLGTGGINADSPPWSVGATQAQWMRDVVIHEGLATQRRGWENYLGPVADSVGNPIGLGLYFVSPTGLVSTVVSTYRASDNNYGIYSQNQVTPSWSPILYPTAAITPKYVPRAQYRDEILLCDQNGVYPMLRFLGKIGDAINALTVGIPANSSVITPAISGGSSIGGAGLVAPPAWSSVNADYGAFLHPYVDREVPSLRVTKQSANDFTVAGIQFVTGASSAGSLGTLQMWGTTWPCVSVADDGFVSQPAIPQSQMNGTGTTFTGGFWGSVFVGAGMLMPMSDSLRVKQTSKWTQHAITSVVSATALAIRPLVGTPIGQNVSYEIMRRSPFRDVEVHQECLWGTGVKQHPNRVYYSTRGWDMQTPPRLTPPWNGVTDFFEPNAGMLDYVEMGGDGSGDRVMALLSSDGPLLILTEQSCYGAYGKWPVFEKQMIASGAGCIDTRSAVGVSSYGQFWAGEVGIYGYRSGKVTDLTAGRINNYWRRLMRRFEESTGSYVVCGVARNHLIVSAKVTAGDEADELVTLGCNLGTGAWTELSNMAAVGMHAPALWDGDEKLLAALSGRKQIIDIAPAINMDGGAKDADGVEPQLSIVSGSGHAGQGDPDGEWRLTEVRIGGVVTDSPVDTGDRTSLTVTVRSDGAVTQGTSVDTNTGVLNSSTSTDIRRERIRVGNSGRTHAVTIATANTSANNQKIAVAEVGMNVRKRRAPR